MENKRVVRGIGEQTFLGPRLPGTVRVTARYTERGPQEGKHNDETQKNPTFKKQGNERNIRNRQSASQWMGIEVAQWLPLCDFSPWRGIWAEVIVKKGVSARSKISATLRGADLA